jgi:hypothetical protein
MHYCGSFQNRRQGACLDSSSGEAYTLGCNTGQYQEWDIRNISANLYYLKNRATGLRLDANSSNKAYPLSCNGGTNRWTRVISSSMTDDELADTTLPFRVAKGEPEPPTVYAGSTSTGRTRTTGSVRPGCAGGT